MKRLTKRIEQYVYYTQGKYEDTLPVEMETNDIRSVLKKLAEYEDLEEQLEKVYGECDGLLETAINSLVRHEGAEIGAPAKARLLTDEDVDKWLAWKDAEEQGLLLRPKCGINSVVYALWSVPTESRYVIYEAEVKEINLSSTNIRKMLMYKIEPIAFRGRYKKYFDDDFGKFVFMSQEEAEQALAKMKEGE